MLSLHHLIFIFSLFLLFFFVLLTFYNQNKLHSRRIIDRRNINVQFGRFLRRALLMDEETCAVGLREHVEHDRDILRLARDFLQASICGTASTRWSDKNNIEQYAKSKEFEVSKLSAT